MKMLPLIATAILSLGVGVIIGKTSLSGQGKEDDSTHSSSTTAEGYRTAKRSGGSAGSDTRSIGRVGSPPPASYDNRIKHMKKLAKKVQFGRGMPDFDALFGVWETAREMSPEEIRQALDELDGGQMGQRDGMFIKAMLVMQLAKKDGPTAMQYAADMKGGRGFPAREMALQAWASSDPKGAYAWYEANKESMTPREGRRFQAGAIAALALEDFDTAFAKAKAVDTLSQGDVLRQFGAAIVSNADQRNQFTKYLLTLENEETRNRVARDMAEQLAQTNVKEAIQFVEKWPSDDKGRLIHEVAEQWAQTEPEKALAWQMSKSDTAEPGRGVDDVFGDWARRDTAAARAWLANQDGNLDKDEMRETAARRVMWDDDYPQAAKWADSIADTEKRHDSYRSIYRRWKRLDKEGADSWLEGLGAEARNAVLPNGSDE